MARTASKAWLAAFAAFLLGLSSHLAAQIAPDMPHVPSPLQSEPDVNGVSLIDGKKDVAMPVVLSTPADPRLTFDKVQNSAPYVTGSSSSNCPDCSLIANFSVHVGASTSESFRCTDGDCQSVTYTGSRLIGIHGGSYNRAPGGEHYSFSVVSTNATSGNTHYYQYYAATASYPDGEVITYTYGDGFMAGDPFNRTFKRPLKLQSNTGYYITVTYQYTGTDVTQPGWGTPAEAALYDPSGTLVRRIDYSGTAITDYGNNVANTGGRTFTTTIANGLGGDLEQNNVTVQLPTEATNQLTITPTLLNGLNLITNVTRDGVAWTYSYVNPQNYLACSPSTFVQRYDSVTVSGPNGYSVRYDMFPTSMFSCANPYHNLIKSRTDELGRVTSYSYDFSSGDRLVGITLPEGNSVSLVYNECSNIVTKSMVAKPGSGLANIVESAVYPSNGIPEDPCPDVTYFRPTSSTDARGHTANYTWNSTTGQLTQDLSPADANGVRRETDITYATNAAGLSLKTLVRVCGQTTTCSSNAESHTEYSYLGNTSLPLTVTQKDEATGVTEVTTYTYDPAGRVLSVQGPMNGVNGTKYFRYDLYGRKIWEIGAADPNTLRVAKRFTYRDSDDKVTKVETGTVTCPTNCNTDTLTLTLLEQTDTTYDSRRYPIREATSSGATNYRVTDRSFLDRGLADCTTVRMNMAALPAPTSTSACATPTVAANPDRITKNLYDNAGQLLKVQKAYGVTTANGFPATLQQDYVTYAYTNNGKQQYLTDANGNKAQYTWDGFDRQSCWIFPSKTTVGVVSGDCITTGDYERSAYDAASNRTSLRKRNASTLTYTYDNLNRMIVKVVPGTTPQTRDVYYTHDILGRQLTAKFDSVAGADGITNVYDRFGNLTSSTIAMAGFSKTLSSLYDLDNNRTRLTHPDTLAMRYDYDTRDRLATVDQGTGTGSPLDNFTYNPDDTLSAKIIGVSAGTPTSTYGYDAIGRLTSQNEVFPAFPTKNVGWTFGLSAASQIASETRDNDAYAYTVVNTSKAYSVNGLNQYTGVAGTTQAYDASGNLTSDGTNTYVYDVENRLVSATVAGVTTNLTYDPLGRLWQVVKGAANTRFLYDGDALVGEYDGGGTLTNRYVHGSNAAADDPLVWYVGSNFATARHLHADHLGSIVAATNCNASAPCLNAYDEYGVPAAANVGRFQYTGQAWLSELGLYYYKARMYSAALGRFLQTDPVGYTGGLNLYAYVSDDPIDGLDPTGNCEWGLAPGNSGSSDCPNPEHSGSQQQSRGIPKQAQASLNRGDASGYWQASPRNPIDAVGKDADLNSKNDSSFGGVAKDRLLSALVNKYAGPVYTENGIPLPRPVNWTAVYREYDAIRLALARADAAAIRADIRGSPHLLSVRQITAYHWRVFERFGLPRQTFGGTPLFGQMWEAEATNRAFEWCGSCDRVP